MLPLVLLISSSLRSKISSQYDYFGTRKHKDTETQRINNLFYFQLRASVTQCLCVLKNLQYKSLI